VTAPLDLPAFRTHLERPTVAPADSVRAVFVALRPGEERTFFELCHAYALTRIDPIERQLHDLAAVRLPSEDSAARAAFVSAFIDRAGGLGCVGNWAYFPWDGRVVHVLAEDDYFDVITDRNHDKITVAEQASLRKRRIGVIGLSVGGEAAVTIAQEHLCGELVIADFDRLDLSNMNRLNAGCDELGAPKTNIVARRIAKIDPYLRVTVYDRGVTDGNANDFLLGLDLLVEECDSLPLKYEIRRLARARRINIIFAGDERGFLSIEPHAYEDALRPFHGRVTQPQRAHHDYATAAEFLRALTVWLGGWQSISERSRASLQQIGATRCGYPQLASEARFAAGQLGHVARRLLLGERLAPFIGHMDLTEMLR
jgi:tRNA threonylcarbamoyladenosine dehydratase